MKGVESGAIPDSRGGKEQRRRAILEAATEVFLDEGYDGTSIDDVIERAGGSKRTVYSYFGGKSGLFSAVIAENVERTLIVPLDGKELEELGLRQGLLVFGHRFLELLMTPISVRSYRVIIAEGHRFPELARTFFDAGPGRASAMLMGFLRRLDERGELRVEDPAAAAQALCGLIRGDVHPQVLLGLREPPDDREAEEIVHRAVEIFLGGVTRTE